MWVLWTPRARSVPVLRLWRTWLVMRSPATFCALPRKCICQRDASVAEPANKNRNIPTWVPAFLSYSFYTLAVPNFGPPIHSLRGGSARMCGKPMMMEAERP